MALYDGLRVAPTVDFATTLLKNRGPEELEDLFVAAGITSGKDLLARLRGPPPGDDDARSPAPRSVFV